MADELKDGVWILRLKGFLNWPVNAYLVNDNGVLTLVDSGMPRDASLIRRELRELGYGIKDVDRVLITHYDLDHFGGLLRLSGLDADIYAGGVDARFLSGELKPPLLNHKGAFHRLMSTFVTDLPAQELSDGERIGGFIAYHTPGHNPGHTIYINESVDVGLLGDLVWEQEGTLTTPIWLDSYNMNRLRRSIRDIAFKIPDFDIACVGHGEPLRNGSEELRKLASSL